MGAPTARQEKGRPKPYTVANRKVLRLRATLHRRELDRDPRQYEQDECSHAPLGNGGHVRRRRRWNRWTVVKKCLVRDAARAVALVDAAVWRGYLQILAA